MDAPNTMDITTSMTAWKKTARTIPIPAVSESPLIWLTQQPILMYVSDNAGVEMSFKC